MNSVDDKCYLCGGDLIEEIDNDHVPPSQIYGHGIKKIHNPNLFTLQTHKSCNFSYQYDEDYFINSLAPLALGSYSGNSIIEDIKKRFQEGHRIPLGHAVLEEFVHEPSGLILPNNIIIKKFDRARYRRVIWKIIRGLYFKEHHTVLPESTLFSWDIVSPDYKPPDMFFLIVDKPSKGDYPGVFDYKYSIFPEIKNAHLWALLFWDRIIIITLFHDPNCVCESCRKVKGEISNSLSG